MENTNEMAIVRKKAKTCVRLAIPLADDSNKRPRTEHVSVNNEVTNPLSTFSQQQNISSEIHDEEGSRQDVVCGAERKKSRRINLPKGGAEPLVTRHLVGRSFKSKLHMIWLSLTKENVSKLGIYGMGGFGKTELAKQIHNKLLEHPNFGHVYWVTVSVDFSIHKLQGAIAEALDLDLSNKTDVNIRAALLSRTLTEKKKFVLILDDVWDDVPLDIVGIPDNSKACKIILTTRSLDVCEMMNCQKNVEVDCLAQYLDEDWELFIKQLGKVGSLSEEVKGVAKSIVKRCGGLPLMIVSVAKRMRRMKHICQWRVALEEMKGSKLIGAYVKVFHKLKLIYDHLEDPLLQQCLLYSALFDRFKREEMIEHLIVEGIIEGASSRQAKFDKGNALLYELSNVSLLQRDDNHNEGCFYEHEMVRKMAFYIMNESLPSIIEIGEQIKYSPEKHHQMENIVRISFTKNYNSFIPPDYLLRCYNVSTLLLHENEGLRYVEDFFFDQFEWLKVLNLSGSMIESLPESVGCLNNLRALFFKRCAKLSYIPSLRKLKLLEVLDLSYCWAVEEVPKGVEMLSNLNYLNLFGTGIDELRAGILTRLLRLEYLAFDWPSEVVSAREVADLPKLESLIWCFSHTGDLYSFLNQTQSRSLIKYSLFVGHVDTCESGKEPSSREVTLCESNKSRELIVYEVIQKLRIRKVTFDGGSGLWLINSVGLYSLKTELKSLVISDTKQMEYLFCLWSSALILQSIETLKLTKMKQLRDLFGSERDDGVPFPTPIPDAATFSNLKTFKIESCRTMKKLFPPGLLANLRNLEEISVRRCSVMEEIVSAPEQETTNNASDSNFHQVLQFSLPKLKTLVLLGLPELKSICSAKIKCNSLRDIKIYKCEKLEHIPISLPLPSLISLKVFPEMWWKSVHWGTSDLKDVLQP